MYQVITSIKKRKGIKLDLEMEAADWKEVNLRMLFCPIHLFRVVPKLSLE